MEPTLPRVPADFEHFRVRTAKVSYPSLKHIPGVAGHKVSYPKCKPSGASPKTKLPYGMTPAIMSKHQNFFTTY